MAVRNYEADRPATPCVTIFVPYVKLCTTSVALQQALYVAGLCGIQLADLLSSNCSTSLAFPYVSLHGLMLIMKSYRGSLKCALTDNQSTCRGCYACTALMLSLKTFGNAFMQALHLAD